MQLLGNQHHNRQAAEKHERTENCGRQLKPREGGTEEHDRGRAATFLSSTQTNDASPRKRRFAYSKETERALGNYNVYELVHTKLQLRLINGRSRRRGSNELSNVRLGRGLSFI